MFPRGHRACIGILLIPALWAFSLQWTLEVFHPIEERDSAVHEHAEEGAALYDPSGCAPDNHDRHFCSHSGAYARMANLTSAFQVGVVGLARPLLPVAVVTPQGFDFSERGPPHLG